MPGVKKKMGGTYYRNQKDSKTFATKNSGFMNL